MFKRPLLFIFAVFSLCILLYYRVKACNDTNDKALENTYEGSSVIASGIVGDITGVEGAVKIYLDKSDVRIGQNSIIQGNIILYTGEKAEGLLPGVFVCVKGEYSGFSGPRNDGMFDAYRYYHCRGYAGRVYVEEISIEKQFSLISFMSDSNNFLYSLLQFGRYYIRQKLYLLRLKMSESLFWAFPKDEAGSAMALVLGDKSYLSEDIREEYRNAGILHILSISGLHISVLGLGIYGLLRRFKLSLRGSAILTMFVMLLYAVMTGFSVSTRRAVFMLIVMLFGRCIGKVYDMLSAMSFVGIIILFIQPEYLFDTGFQLSFTAVFAAGLSAELFRITEFRMHNDRRIQSPIVEKIVSALITCIIITLFTMPIIANTYYELPLYGILVNLIVLPSMSFLLGFSITAGITGMFIPIVGRFFAGSAYILFRIIDRICEFTSNLRFCTIVTGEIPALRICFYYLLLAALLVTIKLKWFTGDDEFTELRSFRLFCRLMYIFKTEKNSGRYLSTVLFISILLLITVKEYRTFYTAFLDVGQGDCIYIESCDRCILIDCGSSNIQNVFKNRVLNFLKSKGKNHIDLVIITHPDKDHMSGIKEAYLGNLIDINEVMLSPPAKESSLYKEFTEKTVWINEFTSISEGDEFEVGDCSLRILNPSKSEYPDLNSASVVVRAEYRGFRILFMADCDGVGEKFICKMEDIEADVLKVAHHGSKKATSYELLERVNPRLAVISCSLTNSYGHPSPETIALLRNADCEVFYTMKHGQITIEDR